MTLLRVALLMVLVLAAFRLVLGMVCDCCECEQLRDRLAHGGNVRVGK